MQYPNQIMRKTALMELGFPEEFLDRAYRQKGQKFAQKINPARSKSPIIFDTEEFEKWRLKQLELENKALHMNDQMCG